MIIEISIRMILALTAYKQWAVILVTEHWDSAEMDTWHKEDPNDDELVLYSTQATHKQHGPHLHNHLPDPGDRNPGVYSYFGTYSVHLDVNGKGDLTGYAERGDLVGSIHESRFQYSAKLQES